MDKQIEILLGSKKNIASVVTDNFDKIELSNNVRELTEFTINDDVNSTEVFDSERELNQIYGIYGRLEWMSILNGLTFGLKKNTFQDLFRSSDVLYGKKITQRFRFYLVRPYEYVKLNGSDNQYIRYFQVIATPDDFDIYNAGYSNNVYGEPIYTFNFKKDFDISEYYDQFKFPITELFLYAEYYDTSSDMEYTEFESISSTIKEKFVPDYIGINKMVKTVRGSKIGDIIEYDVNNFSQTLKNEQTYYINLKYYIDNNVQYLKFKYNPFIPIRLRYFSNDLNQVNTGTTSYDDLTSIPTYATKIDDNGNYVWRDILPEGFIDPLTGIGVNHPFMNGRRYLFTTIVLSIVPDMTDNNTKNAFNNMWFENNTIIINNKPNNDLNNIGKPCQG